MGTRVIRPSDDQRELTLAVIEGLKNRGLSQSDIARQFGVTRQAISYYIRKYGGRLTPRQMVLEHFPWAVSTKQSEASACKRLRDHGEYVATGGVGMSYDKIRRLRGFYERLRDQVVEFDPAIPPEEGVSSNGGFAYRKRRESDGDLLIRVNEHTHLSEQGKRIWRFPPMEPCL